MLQARRVRIALACAVLIAIIVGSIWWLADLTREVRSLRAEMPADQSYEVQELRDEIERLERRLDEAEAAAADAESTATEAQDAVDQLRDDVIALGLALSD